MPWLSAHQLLVAESDLPFRMHQTKREMGCSTEDLVRWLPFALGDLYPRAMVELDAKVWLKNENPVVKIFGRSLPGRRIALLNIPVLELSLSFSEELSPSQCEAALKRFDLYTRRGGG